MSQTIHCNQYWTQIRLLPRSGLWAFASMIKSSLKWSWIYAAGVKSRHYFQDKILPGCRMILSSAAVVICALIVNVIVSTPQSQGLNQTTDFPGLLAQLKTPFINLLPQDIFLLISREGKLIIQRRTAGHQQTRWKTIYIGWHRKQRQNFNKT